MGFLKPPLRESPCGQDGTGDPQHCKMGTKGDPWTADPPPISSWTPWHRSPSLCHPCLHEQAGDGVEVARMKMKYG